MQAKLLNKFIDYFRDFMSLTMEEEKAIRDNTTIQHFEKGTVLLRQGQIPRECYFILKGCIRRYHITDGEEITTHFFTEEQWVDSAKSFNEKTPAEHYFSCVEDSILVIGNDKKGEQLLEKFPKFEKISRLIVENNIGNLQEKMASYISDSPEQRYINLLENRPELIQRVPQYQLASYIGVKPESLSRIRKRIRRRNKA